MPIKSNLPDLSPARDRYAVEITLPSGGYVDREAFPNGLIKVYPWTSELDEWVVKRTGNTQKVIVHDLLPKLCDLNGCEPESFLISEALLVWMVSRSIRSDRKVSFSTTCPTCSTTSSLNITVPDDLERTGEKPAGYQGTDTVMLPSTKDVVRHAPITVGKSRTVVQRPDKGYPDTVATLGSAIVDVNGGKPDSLAEACDYVNALPPADFEALKVSVESGMPGLSNILQIQCDECGHEYPHTIKFTEVFFR